ncbi:DUF805 domain-containing protein [Horticoccus luteus]|uniref:DUF805 domain-containing protein n=1 Tax=Horticoccus luteus TaxID=2862869 RepID=A0A8F9TUV8_9BACT|nr:DUF805 domain-containing protein [Horticoccus luteus]QYM78718.1 DUF805 domain-containing protein [Horticoccus luteus]
MDIQAHVSLLELHVLASGFGCFGYTPHPCGSALFEGNPRSPGTSTLFAFRSFIAAIMPGQNTMTEENAYNAALQELQTQQVSQGIWVKAMAFSEGDEKKAKANYLRFRAEQLLKAERGYATATIGVGIASILFSPYGKIPRSIFTILLFCCAFIFILGGVIIKSQGQGYYSSGGDLAIILCLPFFILSGWTFICAHIKRARDLGNSPYMIFFYVIPWVGWLFLLFFIFSPSVNANTQKTEKKTRAEL